MSIKLMSAIFETEFPETLQGEDIKSKGSTAKLVLLAIADHANDFGESAYPGLTKLEKKTCLSRQGIIDTINVLKFNGLLVVDEEKSRLGTNSYTVVTQAYPVLRDDFEDGQATLLVKPLDHPSQATLPEVVKPLDLNHTLTTINHPSEKKNFSSKEKAELLQKGGVEWLVAAGVSDDEVARLLEKEQSSKERRETYEREMGFNPLKWGSKRLERLGRFIDDQLPEDIKTFADWCKRPYSSFTPAKASQYPEQVIELFPQAFPELFEKKIVKPDPMERYWQYLDELEENKNDDIEG